eukprot:188817-Rhodomonas_salina.3
MALLMKAGHDVHLKVGSPQYPAMKMGAASTLMMATQSVCAFRTTSGNYLWPLSTWTHQALIQLTTTSVWLQAFRCQFSLWSSLLPGGSRTYCRSKCVKQKQRQPAPARLQPSRNPDAPAEEITDSDSDPESSSVQSEDQSACTEAHIDFAHGSKLCVHKEKYYLLFVLGSSASDFTWATSTTTRASPEKLLLDFLRHTSVKIKTLCVDGEHCIGGGTSRFEAYCESQGITICQAAAYNHTSQVCIEGTVRITKEHMHCLLKTANTPARFWPWALEHFCCVYNHWMVADLSQPWNRLAGHDFCQDYELDIQVWGCYCTGFLPHKHQLVVDGTNYDRHIKGVFLGWDLTSPTVWLWWVKHKKEMIPLHDPSCLVNSQHLSDTDVVSMHH